MNSVTLAEYDYLDLSHVVGVDLPEPDVHANLFDGNDNYTRFGGFNRVIEYRWTKRYDTGLAEIAGVVQARERRRFVGIRGGTGLDGDGSGSYIDTVILRDRDANATGGWAGERRHCGPPRGRAADAYVGRDAHVATVVAPPRRICDFTPSRLPA